MRQGVERVGSGSIAAGGSHLMDQGPSKIETKVRDLAGNAFDSVKQFGKNKVAGYCITSGASSVPLMKAVLVVGCLRALKQPKKNN